MSKQSEVFYILQDVRLGNLSEFEATLKLQELGVVIKVDRELPENPYDSRPKWTFPFGERLCSKEWVAWYSASVSYSYAGYEAVENLIKE